MSNTGGPVGDLRPWLVEFVQRCEPNNVTGR
jgi:hypothetical protein